MCLNKEMNKFFFTLLFPAICFAFSQTPQEKCGHIDLRILSPIGEVRNQKEVAWCYAFTGADMLEHTFDIQEKISAADMAISYNQTKLGKLIRFFDLNVLNRKDDDLIKVAHQTGLNKFSLERALKLGWCPERVFPSESWIKVSRSPSGWREEEQPLDSSMKDIYALHKIKEKLTSENLPYYFKFKNVDQKIFLELLRNKNITSFYNSLRETACKDDRSAFESRPKVKMEFKNNKIFKRISQQLEASRLVGLDYNNRILKNSANRGVKFSGLHTSSFVGRRWNAEQNSCEFLIRNSYGDKCDEKYDPSYECDAGNVWISESKIYSNLLSIVYMPVN